MQIKLKEIKVNVKYKQETDLFIDNNVICFPTCTWNYNSRRVNNNLDNANEKLEDLNLLIKHLQETVRLISVYSPTCKKEQ